MRSFEGALAHQEMPLELIVVRRTVTVPKKEFVPMPHVSIKLHEMRAQPSVQAGHRASTINEERAAVEWTRDGLQIQCIQGPDSVRVVLVYAVDWFTGDAIRDLLAGLQALVQIVVTAPSTRITDLPIAPAAREAVS